MSNLRETKDFPTVIDSTMRSAFVSCPQKYFWNYFRGFNSKGGSVHLVAGGAFAKGVETVRENFYIHGKSEIDSIVAGVEAAFIEYGSFEPPEKSYKTPERVGYAIADYFTEYPPGTDKIQPYETNGKPAIEFSFAFPTEIPHPTTGAPILYAGRFDMVGIFSNGIYAVDEKTASRLGPSWIKSFKLRGQMLGYVYAAKMYGIPVNGFIIRGTSFLKDTYGHAEIIEMVPEYRLAQWKTQLEKDITRMIECWKKDSWDFAFGDACNAYGGCSFQVLCEKANPEDWVDMYFEPHNWSPLDINGMDKENNLTTNILEKLKIPS